VGFFRAYYGWRLSLYLGNSTSIVAILGGLFGGRISIKTKPEKPKQMFAYATLATAIFMICHALFIS